MKFTIDQKIACLSRELKMRRKVYSRQVEEGRMDAATAEREIGIMREILDDYDAKAEAEKPSLGLFQPTK